MPPEVITPRAEITLWQKKAIEDMVRSFDSIYGQNYVTSAELEAKGFMVGIDLGAPDEEVPVVLGDVPDEVAVKRVPMEGV